MNKMLRLLSVIAVFFVFLSPAFAEVIPDYYSSPGLDPNRDYLNQQVNEHIGLFCVSVENNWLFCVSVESQRLAA